MSAPASTPPQSQADATIVSVADLDAVRDLVYRRRSDAKRAAADLRDRLHALGARADLLAVLAEANDDEERARVHVDEALHAVKALHPDDPETLLDIALGLLVADRPADAAQLVLNGIEAASSGKLPPTVLLVGIDRLLDGRWREEADQLLQSVLQRLALSMLPPDAHGCEGAEAIPSAQRRVLREALRYVEARLGDRPHDRTLRTLHAAGLVAAGRAEEGLAAVDALPTEDRDVRARWVRIMALTMLGRAEDALEALDRVGEYPAGPLVVALRVRLLTRLGRVPEALAAVEAAQRAGVDAIELGLAHAQALAAAGRHDEALHLLEQLSRDHDGHVAPLKLRAEILSSTHDAQAAIDTLHEVVHSAPDDAQAHVHLSRLYTESGDRGIALKEIDRALRLEPGRADLLLDRARLLRFDGNHVEALKMVELALGAGATGAEPSALRADLLRELDRPEEALRSYLRALSAEPDTGDAMRYIAAIEALAYKLLISDSSRAALDGLDTLGERRTPYGQAIRAELLRLTDQSEAAVEEADLAIAAGYDRVWMAGTKAAALTALSRSAEALTVIEEALENEPEYGFARSVQVMALDEVGRVTEALEVLDRHLAPDPNWRRWAIMARGQLLLHLGLIREAHDGLAVALEDEPHEPDWLASHALAAHRLGDLPTAIDHLREAVALTDSPLPWAFLALADALADEASHVTHEARGLYERAVGAGFAASRPKSGPQVGWAQLRLGNVKDAIAAYERGFAHSEDLMLHEHLAFAAVLAVADDGERSARELDRVLQVIAQLHDRQRAEGALAEGRHLLRLLRSDAAWRDRAERLAPMAELIETPGIERR